MLTLLPSLIFFFTRGLRYTIMCTDLFIVRYVGTSNSAKHNVDTIFIHTYIRYSCFALHNAFGHEMFVYFCDFFCGKKGDFFWRLELRRQKILGLEQNRALFLMLATISFFYPSQTRLYIHTQHFHSESRVMMTNFNKFSKNWRYIVWSDNSYRIYKTCENSKFVKEDGKPAILLYIRFITSYFAFYTPFFYMKFIGVP